MSTKIKPGIHLYKKNYFMPAKKNNRVESKTLWHWHARSKNGRITASGETYSRKSIALNSIRSTAVTLGGPGKFKYYDHSKKDSPLANYL